jgi:hypothetical protein
VAPSNATATCRASATGLPCERSHPAAARPAELAHVIPRPHARLWRPGRSESPDCINVVGRGRGREPRPLLCLIRSCMPRLRASSATSRLLGRRAARAIHAPCPRAGAARSVLVPGAVCGWERASRSSTARFLAPPRPSTSSGSGLVKKLALVWRPRSKCYARVRHSDTAPVSVCRTEFDLARRVKSSAAPVAQVRLTCAALLGERGSARSCF